MLSFPWLSRRDLYCHPGSGFAAAGSVPSQVLPLSQGPSVPKLDGCHRRRLRGQAQFVSGQQHVLCMGCPLCWGQASPRSTAHWLGLPCLCSARCCPNTPLTCADTPSCLTHQSLRLRKWGVWPNAGCGPFMGNVLSLGFIGTPSVSRGALLSSSGFTLDLGEEVQGAGRAGDGPAGSEN